MPVGVTLGPHTKVYNGEFIGAQKVPQYLWICAQCYAEGADPFIFGPPFSPDEINVNRVTA